MEILKQSEQWPERVAAIRQSQEGPPPNPPSYPTDPLRPPSNSVGPGGTPPPEDDTASLPPPVNVPPPGPAQPGTGSGLPPNIWGPPSETIPQIPGMFPIPAIPGLGMVPPEGTLPTAPRPTTGSKRDDQRQAGRDHMPVIRNDDVFIFPGEESGLYGEDEDHPYDAIVKRNPHGDGWDVLRPLS